MLFLSCLKLGKADWNLGHRQQEAAVFLQSPHETEEGHTCDDDAAGEKNVGRAGAGNAGGEHGHPDGHQQVDAKAEHSHATNLTTEQLISANTIASKLQFHVDTGLRPCRLKFPRARSWTLRPYTLNTIWNKEPPYLRLWSTETKPNIWDIFIVKISVMSLDFCTLRWNICSINV